MINPILHWGNHNISEPDFPHPSGGASFSQIPLIETGVIPDTSAHRVLRGSLRATLPICSWCSKGSVFSSPALTAQRPMLLHTFVFHFLGGLRPVTGIPRSKPIPGWGTYLNIRKWSFFGTPREKPIIPMCTGFAWQGFGSVEARGVTSERCC